MMSPATSQKYCPVCSLRLPATDGPQMCTVDGAELLPVIHDELVGRIVDSKFELLDIIGTGGYSTVYRARQIGLDRLVAFKLLRADLVSTVERIKRFEQEAHLASSLSHRNICAVYDCGILDTGQPYLVLENVEGQSLEYILQRGRVLPEARALELIKQIATGLQAAHSEGILHRDLKPSNVMIVSTNDGELVKIIDFGLAKLFGIQSREQLSIAGETMGTPAYMSPEQVQGKPLDARSDIYTFGCIIYEMLCGKRAVDGKNAFEVMLNHLHRDPPPLQDGAYIVPFELRELTLKCLSKDPAKRYASAKEIQDDIEKIESSGVLDKIQKRSFWHLPFKRAVVPTAVAAILVAVLGIGYKVATTHSAQPVGPIVTEVKYSPGVAHSMAEFDDLMSSFQLVAGEQVGKRTFDMLQASGKQFTPDMVLVSKKMILYQLTDGRRAQSIPYIKAWLAAKVHLTAPGSQELLDAYKQAGHDFQAAVQEQDALAQYKKVLEITVQLYGKTSPEYFDALYELAQAHLRCCNYADSEAMLNELSKAKDSKYAPSGAFGLKVLIDLCDSYIGEQKMSDAKRVADQIVAALTPLTPSATRMNVFKTAAHAAERRRDYKQAVTLIDKAIELSKAVPDPRPAGYVTDELLTMKGSYLRQAGDNAQASAVLKAALSHIGKSHQPESNEYRFCLSEYVKLLRATAKQKEADALELSGRYQGDGA